MSPELKGGSAQPSHRLLGRSTDWPLMTPQDLREESHAAGTLTLRKVLALARDGSGSGTAEGSWK